jgi:glucose-induced degradation protein 8
MDYLVTNGYPAAANRFAIEANIQPKSDTTSIEERVEIRSAIHSGDIQTAIEKINESNPQVGFFQ